MDEQTNDTELKVAQNNKFVLPSFMLKQPDGIFVDLSIFPVGGGFEKMIDMLFSEGVRFRGLDYSLLMELLHDYDAIVDKHSVTDRLKLADELLVFPPERQALYKAVKVDATGKRAEYFFEPVVLEMDREVSVYGEPDDEGVTPIVGFTMGQEMQATQLDLGEFIAAMWLKNVRYGIDVEVVSDAITRGATERLVVAVQREATEGRDAEIEEACTVLHRDNSPKLLFNGKVDLHRFQNRFPQIAMDVRLLKKKSRVLGKQGYKVTGEIIEPAIPKDEIDLYALAGPGTRVETQDACEYIVANQDGFLSLNEKSNNISVTEKIENKSGISLKTTGDLSLSGNEFIEHGEVQEGRVVEGHNMTFRSDVYGDIVSQGGLILLEGNLSSGSAKSYGGDVTSTGRVFNSEIEASTGHVTLKYAESSVILGASVTIERAVNCDIVAENVELSRAEGCAIAGKNVKINSSSVCRDKETLVSMIVPDLSALDEQLAQLSREVGEGTKIVEAKDRELARIKSDTEFAKYLGLAASIRQGKVKLNAAQQAGWQKLTGKFSKIMSAGSKLNAEKKAQLTLIQDLELERMQLIEARRAACTGVHCEIIDVLGDTRVQSMLAEIADLHADEASIIRDRLRKPDVKHKQVFSNEMGRLDWSYKVPEAGAK
ncbi:MAG: flagellar assembly protein A [Gallionella sp.]